MRRHRQSLEELLDQLSPVATDWQDEHSERVIQRLLSIPVKPTYTRQDLAALLQDIGTAGPARKAYFEEGLTVIRLFLDVSKDEFKAALRERLGSGVGVKLFASNPDRLYEALEELGILARMTAVINAPATWVDLLTERLKAGRGSAIKGQRRGRFLEDFVESLLVKIVGEDGFDVRCRFTGANGTSNEKADFAIPSKSDPSILIEAKAYGATGSKQTDVLGDISRICREKRSDTYFLLVTDGITWRERVNDLRKLVELQNRGEIARIYTRSMIDQLEADLRALKEECDL